jgi:hypothetical protein
MTSFASANTYQTLDNSTTDDESADLLTAPEFPVDPTATVFPLEDSECELVRTVFPVEDSECKLVRTVDLPATTLNNVTTDDESADPLTAPDIPVDLPATVFPVADVDLTAPEFLDVGDPPVDPGDTDDVALGNVFKTALRRLDKKWTTILTDYNNGLEKQRCQDDVQRRYDKEKCDEQRRYDKEKRNEQRRLDRKEQRQINVELRTAKKLDFEALLASSKDAFTTEMKDTFDGLRSELSTWKTSLNDSMTRNTTTLQAEMKAAIDTPAALSLKATVDGLMDTVPTFMQEIQATVTVLSGTVKSLDEKIIRLHGHFTKTTVPTLSSRLDILEARSTSVSTAVAEDLSSCLDILEARATSIPRTVAEESPPSLPPESNAAPPPAALPAALPSDPPDDLVTLTPRVPDRVPYIFAAERVHQLAPPHISPQSNLASPGSNTGNSGDKAPMADPPDTMANNRVAFTAFRARMSHEAAGETIGHTDGARLSHLAANEADNHSPPAPSAHTTSGGHVTPNQDTPSHPSN